MKPKYDPKKRGGLNHVGDILNYIFHKEVRLPDFGPEQRIFSLWEACVGLDIARQTKPNAFKNGILFVDTAHPAWTTELRFRSQQIKNKLNEKLGQEIVQEIQFRQGRTNTSK